MAKAWHVAIVFQIAQQVVRSASGMFGSVFGSLFGSVRPGGEPVSAVGAQVEASRELSRRDPVRRLPRQRGVLLSTAIRALTASQQRERALNRRIGGGEAHLFGLR